MSGEISLTMSPGNGASAFNKITKVFTLEYFS